MIRRIIFAHRIRRIREEREALTKQITEARRLRRPVAPLYARQRAVTHELVRLGA